MFQLRQRFAKAMKLMEERARVPLFLTYRAVGSGTGQKEFVGNAAVRRLPCEKATLSIAFSIAFL